MKVTKTKIIAPKTSTCITPITPGMAPRTPPSLQLVTASGGGGLGYRHL